MAGYNSNVWLDTAQYEDYRVALRTVPRSGGEYAQPMFCYKYMSCEFGPDDECACTLYENNCRDKHGYEEIETKHLLRYHKAGVWSDIMSAPESTLLSPRAVEYYI
jgi:hypothetical protein